MKTFSRSLLPLPLLLAAGALPLSADHPSEPVAQTPLLPVLDKSCKPVAPIHVTLEALPGTASEVQLRFRIEPVVPMEALDWELELPADTFLAKGQRTGTARLESGAGTEGRWTLSMPADQNYRKVRLMVRGIFAGFDENGSTGAEPVVVSSSVTWGTPPAVGPLVDSPDGPERELLPHIVLPTTHRARTLLDNPISVNPPMKSALGGFTVTGVFEYEDKEWGYSGWTGVDPILPIRRADVTVLDDNTSSVLGTGTTAADGSFNIACTGAGTTDIIVRVNADTFLNTGFQRIRCTDGSNAEYTAFSPVFPSHNTSVDLDTGTTTVNKILFGSDEANPFNMFDMGIAAWEYITGPLVGETTGSAVRVSWPSGGGSFASGFSAFMSDDDGYDDAVILHELGHVVHNLYSDSDNPGGSHSFGDSDQDPRLSMGEGYASFFGGTVMLESLARQALYVDANGNSQTNGFQLRLRMEGVAPYSNDSYGAADEVSVAVTLLDILDDEDSIDNQLGIDDDLFVSTTLINGLNPHKAWWDVFTGPVQTAPNLTINDAWNGWFSEHGTGGLHADFEDLFELRRCFFSNDVDEPNNTTGTATPLFFDSAWSGHRTIYSATGTPPSPGFGDVDWYEADLVIGSIVELETRYPAGVADADTQADTQLQFVSPLGATTTNANGGVGRNAKILNHEITETGKWRIRVQSTHSYRRYGRYNYRFQYIFENLLPTITAGPSATPAVIGPFHDDTQLSVNATDDQPAITLTYTWTPLSGGTIVGSGSNVTFVPPNKKNAAYPVELVIEDPFGAQTTSTVLVKVRRSAIHLPQANAVER